MLEIRWRCRAGCTVAPGPGGVELAVDGGKPVRIPMRPSLARRLAGLGQGRSEAALAAAAGGDPVAIALALRFIGRLRARGLLVADLWWRARRLATLRPTTADFALPAGAARSAAGQPLRWRLSRFAWLRRAGRQWLLEATEAHCDVLIDDPGIVGWLHDTTPAEPESARFRVLDLLARLGFLDDFDSADDEEPAVRRTWEFHDRLFHDRSRAFGVLRRIGGTFRFAGRQEDGGTAELPSPPALREPYDGDTIDLPAPDVRGSRPLADVMDRRRSRRSMGDPPVSLAAASALLHRVGRVTGRLPGGHLMRPYPSGGALHELEFYLAVRECRGLDAGFYHYRGDAHVLTRLPGAAAGKASAAMIDDCALAWVQPGQPPQCLVVISSRVPRVAWKYEGIAYRLSLLNAGVVLQSLYLVATDLGLHGCAAGSGNPALFARATGVSTWAETSIAGFGFGSGASA